jgi:hypothetical protein
MSSRTAITVYRDRAETQRLWSDPEFRPEHMQDLDAKVTFKEAPGDRGTEIRVEIADSSRLGAVTQRFSGADPLAKAKDDLRRFKQHVETGVIARSDGSPEGERAERKLKRPAQPLDEAEMRKAGV